MCGCHVKDRCKEGVWHQHDAAELLGDIPSQIEALTGALVRIEARLSDAMLTRRLQSAKQITLH